MTDETLPSEIQEKIRLLEDKEGVAPWKKWGPYLSERQWGTVREDYSQNGDAWNYFTHDQARSRAYRWGEDGIAGISDNTQHLCFSVALWNGKDPILKERLFGLTNQEGNHGEDVKEYYFYLDSTPTHSYMKYLYKYPQNAYPYMDLIDGNRRRGKLEPEYELLDTGVFSEHKYFDIFVEYAKESAEDIYIKISVFNRGPEDALLELLPTLWFRNTWSWSNGGPKPAMRALSKDKHCGVHTLHHETNFAEQTKDHFFYCDRTVQLLFTENETNKQKVFGQTNTGHYFKDGINEYIVNENRHAINPDKRGTKVAARYRLNVKAGECEVVKLRLGSKRTEHPFENFDTVFDTRMREADSFYDDLIPDNLKQENDKYDLMRQALSGMLWGKQFFHYDVDQWIKEHNINIWTMPSHLKVIRNQEWTHMYNNDIISMPDKWEYPWYASWDLAFHTLPLNLVDSDFTKDQLDLILRSSYIHPNGQIPAYEWNFSDVNPPVHAYATYQAYLFDKGKNNGVGDKDFLKYAFTTLLSNFTWWVNRKDPRGHGVFEGGFLGLDNISVFDRSSQLPTGGYLEQADGTGWMVFFSQQMLNIAIELAQYNSWYERFALKFFEHTVLIAASMDKPGKHRAELWDEEDGFFYDVLRYPDGHATRLKVRSIVGLLPMASVVVFENDVWDNLPGFKNKAFHFTHRQQEACKFIHLPFHQGYKGRRMLSVCNEKKLRRILSKLFDENEFLSDFGIRSLSKYHKDNPFVYNVNGHEYRVDYLPGESNSGMYGGNSNWRGPIWLPVNFMLIRALFNYFAYFGPDFLIEYPTGSGVQKNLCQVANDIIDRITNIFLKDKNGFRPVYGDLNTFQYDENWNQFHQFFEYFNGDTGSGLGASHQTGWTGLVSMLLYMRYYMNEEDWLAPSPAQTLANIST